MLYCSAALGESVCQCFVRVRNCETVCYFGGDTSNCHGPRFTAEQEGKGSTLTHSSVASSILRWQQACEWKYIFLFLFSTVT